MALGRTSSAHLHRPRHANLRQGFGRRARAEYLDGLPASRYFADVSQLQAILSRYFAPKRNPWHPQAPQRATDRLYDAALGRCEDVLRRRVDRMHKNGELLRRVRSDLLREVRLRRIIGDAGSPSGRYSSDLVRDNFILADLLDRSARAALNPSDGYSDTGPVLAVAPRTALSLILGRAGGLGMLCQTNCCRRQTRRAVAPPSPASSGRGALFLLPAPTTLPLGGIRA